MRPWVLALIVSGCAQLVGIHDQDIDANTASPIAPAIELELVAGDIGGPGNINGTMANARFNQPAGVAIGADGNLYVADYGNNEIRIVTPQGVVSTYAGSAGSSAEVDGSLVTARFEGPYAIAVDGAGNLYVADARGDTIRKITIASGMVTTLAGLAGSAGFANAAGSAARFDGPLGIAVGSDGSVYVGDTNNDLIRMISPSGMVSTLAGSAGSAAFADGSATARFNLPEGVAVDGFNVVYVADSHNRAIRSITNGVVTTAYGSPSSTTVQDPVGIAVAGELFITDYVAATIFTWGTLTGVKPVAGISGSPGFIDGPVAQAQFDQPAGIAIDGSGNLYIGDQQNSTIREISSSTVSTLAGAPARPGHVDSAGTDARFRGPQGVVADASGNAFVCDSQSGTIREVAPDGTTSTIAGTDGLFGSTDDTGAAARFNFPVGISIDGSENLYVADTNNATIRKITPAAVVTTIAGLALETGTQNGMGSAARFDAPQALAAVGNNIDVADTGNDAIRVVTPAGAIAIVSTLAMQLDVPSAIAADLTGNLYVSDSMDDTIRKITPDGIVSTLAGLANTAGSTDGTGSNARFSYPLGIAVNATGDVFVADNHNATIRKITAEGVTTTIAGVPGQSGVFLGPTPTLASPRGLALSGSDDLLITDANALLVLQHGAR